MSLAPSNHNPGNQTLTLGELLYADRSIALVSEKQWLSAVRAVAAGDRAALRLLYEQAFPVVFTYLMRLTGSRHLTDTLILDVFELVWCEAPVFDAADGPVLGWIMRQARKLALMHAGSSSAGDSDQGIVVAAIGDGERDSPVNLSLQAALVQLTLDEREAIEATFLNGSTYAEFGARTGLSIGTIKNRIRSGMVKLQQALPPRSEES